MFKGGFEHFGVYNYRIWLVSSDGAFSTKNLRVFVNGSPRTWFFTGNPAPSAVKKKGGLVIFLKALPPDTVPIVTLKFQSLQTGESTSLDIPNPSYKRMSK
jgi:hypothetical protein